MATSGKLSEVNRAEVNNLRDKLTDHRIGLTKLWDCIPAGNTYDTVYCARSLWIKILLKIIHAVFHFCFAKLLVHYYFVYRILYTK